MSERWQGRRVWRETHASGQTGERALLQRLLREGARTSACLMFPSSGSIFAGILTGTSG